MFLCKKQRAELILPKPVEELWVLLAFDAVGWHGTVSTPLKPRAVKRRAHTLYTLDASSMMHNIYLHKHSYAVHSFAVQKSGALSVA